MPKIVIHIGPHKTGSTALQNFFHINRKKLFNRGLCYETLDYAWHNHHFLANCFQHNEEHIKIGQECVEKIIRMAGQRTVLFSSEMFCEPIFDAGRFLRALDGNEIQVIGYLRHPCDLLLSAFNELVRNHDSGWTHSVNEQPYSYDPSTHSLFEKWLLPEIFQIAPYDQVQWEGRSLFLDFLKMIDIDFTGLDVDQVPKNTSIPFPLIEVLRAMNQAGVEDPYRMQAVEIMMKSHLTETSYPLNEETQHMCFERMKSALEKFQDFLRPGFEEGYLFEARN